LELELALDRLVPSPAPRPTIRRRSTRPIAPNTTSFFFLLQPATAVRARAIALALAAAASAGGAPPAAFGSWLDAAFFVTVWREQNHVRRRCGGVIGRCWCNAVLVERAVGLLRRRGIGAGRLARMWIAGVHRGEMSMRWVDVGILIVWVPRGNAATRLLEVGVVIIRINRRDVGTVLLIAWVLVVRIRGTGVCVIRVVV
jgi:hypothetical protein